MSPAMRERRIHGTVMPAKISSGGTIRPPCAVDTGVFY